MRYVLIAIIAAAGLWIGHAEANTLPVCQIKNPPYAPNRFPDPQIDVKEESTIVEAQISNRCQAKVMGSVPGFDHEVEMWAAAQVWQLGAWACLQAREWPNRPWVNVWCEANQVYFKASLSVYVAHEAKRARHWWQWRVQGHAWVFYSAGDPTPYRSKTVTSPFVPLRLKP